MGSLKKNVGDISDKNVHPVLEHGEEVLQEYLKTFGFTSMKEVENYLEKPAVTNFNHIPQTVLLEILMVAEKPSTALEIVHRLSLGHFSSSGLGQNKVYYFQGMVFGRHANVWVVSTFGHLTEQSFTEELSCDEDEKALFARVADTSSNSSLSYEFFAKLGRGCDAVILWLDNDHEGEAISFEVIRFLYGYVKVPQGRNPMDAFFRARFSSPSEAFSAIKSLDRPNFKRYMAMVCKHIIDLRVGVAFSRCQKFAAKKILDMYIWKLAYGPCSTACIAMAVDQHLYNLKVIDLLPKFCLEFVVDVDGQKVVILSEPLDEEEAKKRVASLQL
uniref:DNA topoisomerase n=1 Tax=Panagrolaimus davidi TaxID=227884 RepID=A0A914QK07_9BILA